MKRRPALQKAAPVPPLTTILRGAAYWMTTPSYRLGYGCGVLDAQGRTKTSKILKEGRLFEHRNPAEFERGYRDGLARVGKPQAG